MISIKLKILIPFLLLSLFSSCDQTNSQSPIVDDIKQKDTLTLYAQYADCGEWGGHIEKIFLTKKGNDFFGTFYKDSVSCETDPNSTRKKIIKKSKILSIADINSIVKYVNEFNVACKKEQFESSNATNYFQLINKNTTIRFIDWSMEWKEFKVMKEKIFDSK